ncbi:hypothetical protein A2757_01590 [Candidatus Giovannonibacteria bacterium RIFCSPHIGHO2_01_FULL_48_47]|nr:MAG: hypothetical protein A2757_01590 [Candidatus Giovannonibacteria bacterium RIFCSPHIGHO2_01_FULL_48_47]OGF68899.1 MAG: hypothetical protein A3D61_03125 [Candidatus Giovannonibacteria bacterium RIFCSPHIGHO2_02_FULL_48_15]OGF88528.1 MAG: hypothetical protein A3B26_00055 [Candidatus Giovannonibacteria bacterium RIFCSPLOWO2_01_FULL_48_47]OGF95409.1 MAG: hypothetical protein A2433_00240 [Candidatus Giovannonibacteria bacterium RIFOXYC1_FULL_48_8]OGF96413.1 MAG: hypothetical protein A2613_02545
MKKRFKYLFILGLVAITALLWRQVFYLEKRELKFYVLDVGQGDAIFIETPTKNQILIDGGPERSVLEELGEVMPFYDRTIDLVLLTHPNLDHAAGLVNVLKSYEVKYFVDTDDSYYLAEYEELKKIVEEKNISRVIARRGTKIVLDRGAELVILHPDKLAKGEPNQNSIITQLSFGDIDFLLTGDAEKGEELKLIENGDDLQSEVLKVGHHGSKTSSNPLFLEKVKPRYALISVGRQNRYGHPASEVLNSLALAGAKIFRTDADSRIKIESNGTDLTVSPEK